jgi:hypothetical protein
MRDCSAFHAKQRFWRAPVSWPLGTTAFRPKRLFQEGVPIAAAHFTESARDQFGHGGILRAGDADDLEEMT